MKKILLLISMILSVLFISAGSIAIGDGNVTDVKVPLSFNYRYSWSSWTYTSNELGDTKDISSIDLLLRYVPYNSTPLTNQKLYLKHVQNEEVETTYPNPTENGFTLVFDGTVNLEAGWNNIPFINNFRYNGESNLQFVWENSCNEYHTGSASFIVTNSENNRSVSNRSDASLPTEDGTLHDLYPNAKINYFVDNEPETATLIAPLDNAQEVDIDTELQWINNNNTDVVKVFISSEKDNVENNLDSALIVDELDLTSYNTNLENNKTYFWKVVAINNTSHIEVTSEIRKFTTTFGNMTIPYTEDFEVSTDLPDGWNSIDQGTSYGSIKVSFSDAFEGSKTLKIYNGCDDYAAHNMIAITPKFENNGARVRFYAKGNNNAVLNVGYLSDMLNPETFTSLQTINLTEEYTEYKVVLENDRNINYVGFKHGMTNSYQKILIDNLSFEEAPENEPARPSLQLPDDLATNLPLDQQLQWNNGINTDVVDLYLSVNQEDVENNVISAKVIDSQNVESYSYSFENAQQYFWKVVAINNTSNIHLESEIRTFTTSYGIAEKPYSENFDEIAFYGLPMGWSFFTDTNINNSLVSVIDDEDNAYENKSLKINNAGNTFGNIIAISPQFDVTNARVKFKAKSSRDNSTLIVGTITDRNDASSFLAIDTINLSNEYKNYSVRLNVTERENQHLALKHGLDATFISIYLDNLTIEDIPEDEPIPATLNTPLDEANDVPILTNFQWNNGAQTSAINLYLSENIADVENSNENAKIVSNQNIEFYILTEALNEWTTYYWKIESINNNITVSSDIFSFMTVLPDGIYQIGQGDITNTNLPVEPNYGYSYSQSIYTPEELNVFGTINSIAWHYNGNSAWSDNVVIYMGTTNQDHFGSSCSWIDVNELTEVYSGNFVTSNEDGWVSINLTTPYLYNGTGNLVVAFDENTSGYHSGNDEFFASTTDYYSSAYYRNDNNNPDPTEPPTATYKNAHPNLMLQVDEIEVHFPEVNLVSPTNHAVDIEYVTDLTWEINSNTTGIDLYFSTSYEDVANNVESTKLLDNSLDTTYHLENLTAWTNYYWKIVTKNSNENLVVNSDIWNFTTALDDQLELVGNGDSINNSLPLEAYYKYSYSQTIYNKDDITKDGDITAIKWHYNGSHAWSNNVIVSIGLTSKTQFDSKNDWIPNSDLTEVFNGEISVPENDTWIEIPFSEAFNFDNSQNIVIAVDKDATSCNSNSDEFFCTSTEDNVSLEQHSDNTNFDVNQPCEANKLRSAYPNIVLSFAELAPVLPVVTNLVASIDIDDVNISWTTPEISDLTLINYEIFRNNESIATSATNSYSDIDVPEGAYSYKIKTNYQEGTSDFSQSININISVSQNDFDVPQNLTANAVNNNVTLNWEAPQHNVETLVLSESFEGIDFPPTGWTLNSQNVLTYTWNHMGIYSGGYSWIPDVSPTNGNYQAGILNSSNTQDEWLISPELSGSSSLSFDYNAEFQNTYASNLFVKVSTDNGQNWITLWNAKELDSHLYSNGSVNIDLSTYHNDNIKLAWHADGPNDTGMCTNIFIDNIKIMGSQQTTHNLSKMKSIALSKTVSRAQTGYHVYRNDTIIDTVSVENLTYNDQSLSNGNYRYHVTAVYNEGESLPSNSTEVTINYDNPLAPSNLTASLNNDNINLVWNTPSEDNRDLEGYKIFRNDTLINELTTDTTYVDNQIPQGSYNYYVIAKYTTLESSPSNIATISVTYLAPTNLNAELSHHTVILTWEEPNDEEVVALTNPHEIKLSPKLNIKSKIDNDLKNEIKAVSGYNLYRNNELLTSLDNETTTYTDEDVENVRYLYYIRAKYGNTESQNSNQVYVQVTANDSNDIVVNTALNGCYPNPFNPETTISFSNKSDGNVQIEVYNMKGQKVRNLVNDRFKAGNHKAVWNGKNDSNCRVASGIYFYRMRIGNYTSTKKMILMK